MVSRVVLLVSLSGLAIPSTIAVSMPAEAPAVATSLPEESGVSFQKISSIRTQQMAMSSIVARKTPTARRAMLQQSLADGSTRQSLDLFIRHMGEHRTYVEGEVQDLQELKAYQDTFLTGLGLTLPGGALFAHWGKRELQRSFDEFRDGAADALFQASMLEAGKLGDVKLLEYEQRFELAEGDPLGLAEAGFDLMNDLYDGEESRGDLDALNRMRAMVGTNIALQARFENRTLRSYMDEQSRLSEAERVAIRAKARDAEREALRASQRVDGLEARVRSVIDKQEGLLGEVGRFKSQLRTIDARSLGNSQKIGVLADLLDRTREQTSRNTQFIFELDTRVDAVEIDVQELESALDAAQSVLFESLTPSQQRRAIESSGFFRKRFRGREGAQLRAAVLSNIKERERAVEREKRRQEVLGDIREIHKGANDLYAIAVNLGLEGKDQERAAEVLKYVNAGAGIAQAYYTGDVLGGIRAASTLFAKDEPSPEALRHQQLMAQLGVIDQKLDFVLTNQQQILKNQAAIADLIIESGESNTLRFDELDFAIKELADDISDVKVGLVESLTALANLNAAREFVGSVEDFNADQHGVRTAEFFSYDDMMFHFRSDPRRRAAWCWDALDGLGEVYQTGAASRGGFVPSAVFQFKNYTRDQRSALRVNRDLYQPLWKHINNTSIRPSQRRNDRIAAFQALMSPERSSSATQQRYLASRSAARSTYIDAYRLEELNSLLLPEVVIEFAELVLVLAPYHELLEDPQSDRLLSPEQILCPPESDEAAQFRRARAGLAKNLLESARFTVEAALVQQSVFAGHLSLPAVRRELEAGIRGQLPNDRMEELHRLLLGNELLARNLLVESIRGSMTDRELGATTYALLFDVGTGMQWRRAMPAGWHIETQRGAPALRLGPSGSEVWLAVPLPDEVMRGGVLLPAEHATLLQLRARLTQAIMEYEAFDGLSEREQRRIIELLRVFSIL